MNPWAIVKSANGDMLTCVLLSTVVIKQLLMNCVNVHMAVCVLYAFMHILIFIVLVLCVLVAFCIRYIIIYYAFSVYQSFARHMHTCT